MLLIKPLLLRKLVTGCALISLLASCSVVEATEGATHRVDVLTIGTVPDKISSALPANTKVYYFNTLNMLYTANGGRAMWEDRLGAELFEQQLAEVALAGFQPQFTQWIELLTNPQISGFARDIILSDAMLGYLHYVEGVKVRGADWLYKYNAYKPDEPSTEMLQSWQRVVGSRDLPTFVAALAPQHVQYSQMRNMMIKLINNPDDWPSVVSKTSIKPNSKISTANVKALKEILDRTAFYTGVDRDKLAQYTASTTYSGELVNGVKRFQLEHGLNDDGVIGKQTRDWLNASPQYRAALMALNLQRLRLLTGDLSSAIMVNIPDYSLVYYIDNQPILVSKVIVGRNERRTPIMDNSLINIVINPPWNVPTKLAREDIIPKIQRDPEYLIRQGITVYSDWGRKAERLDPSEIDWSGVSSKDARFRFQQSPGSGNALGLYKFNMPNSDAIYLHDTPNHRLFNRNVRALSSGCVRVNKASDLAKMLLNDSGWDAKKVASTLKNGKTTHVSLSKQIPVQLYYLTAWLDNDHRMQFRSDIYGYDGSAKKNAKHFEQIRMLLN